MSECKIKFEDFKSDEEKYEVKRHVPAMITISGKLETCGQKQPVNILVITPKDNISLKGNHNDKTGEFEIPFLLPFDPDDDPSGLYHAIGTYLDEEAKPVYSQQINFKVSQIKGL